MSKAKSDVLRPPISLLSKLGAIAVHAQEIRSPHAHPVDIVALDTLLNDPEVKEWLEEMGPLVPVKRT